MSYDWPLQPSLSSTQLSSLHQFRCKDTTASANSVDGLRDVKVTNMHPSLTIEPVRLVRHNLH